MERWTIAKSGVSVDAGDVRIRMEAGAPREELKRLARLIAAAPVLLEAIELVLKDCEDAGAPSAETLEKVAWARIVALQEGA